MVNNVHILLQGVKDVFNHGFYEQPANGKAGKFYDEERTFRDYPQKTSHPKLEVFVHVG